MIPDLEHWKELEAGSRRPTSEAAHPDDCPKLKIKGVAWAIPSRGARLVPTFADGKAAFAVSGQEKHPEAAELLALTAENRQEQTCSKCGQAVAAAVEIDIEQGSKLLDLAATLTAKLLRRQYTLTDEQLGELLAFSADTAPEWLAGILRWASGLPTEGAMPVGVELGELDGEYPELAPFSDSEKTCPAAIKPRGWLRRLLKR